LGDARYISVDSSRSRAELSWLPQIDLRHGEDVAGTSGPSECGGNKRGGAARKGLRSHLHVLFELS
jgi:hypothetical protein